MKMPNNFETHLSNLIAVFSEISINGYDSEESDNIRDKLDVTWYKLTEEEKDITLRMCVLFNRLIALQDKKHA